MAGIRSGEMGRWFDEKRPVYTVHTVHGRDQVELLFIFWEKFSNLVYNRWLSVLIFLSRVHAWVESKDFYYKLGFRLVMVTFVTSIHHFKLLLYSQLR